MRLALRCLRQSPLRTVLCALSVAVGTMALTLIASLGLFAGAQVESGLQTLGVSGLAVSLEERTAGTPLSETVVDEMAQAIDSVEAAMPIKAKTGSVRVGYRAENAVFLGADEQLDAVMHLTTVAGTLFSKAQATRGAAVCVIGDELAQVLFGRDNIVGRQLRLRIDGQDAYYTVCGVVRAQTGALGGTLSAVAPHLVYVPYRCLTDAQAQADQVLVQCAGTASLAETGAQIDRYLTAQRQIGGTVRVRNLSGVVETVRGLAELCSTLFLAVGGVTLLVALIGVLCSMMGAAREKTGEIGVLLALGASPRDIARLFLLQAMLLCAAGGAMGLLLAGVLLWRLAALLLPGAGLCAVLLGMPVICGALAGLLPAWRAARLDPVDAMRK